MANVTSPALIVRAMRADRLRARAERGDGHDDNHDEIGCVLFKGGGEARGVIHHPDRVCDRRFLGEKKWELKIHMGAFRFQPLRQFTKNGVDIVHMQFRAKLIEHLHESAHVRALEVMRQVHREGCRGDGMLNFARLVPDLHRIAKGLHAHPIDGDPAIVGFILGVFQWH